MKRREFLKNAAALSSAPFILSSQSEFGLKEKHNIKFGLVTYLWAKDWDLPTIIKNCEASGVLGVELRVDHAHKVDTYLDAKQRKEIKNQFKKSRVTFVGFGSNLHFDSPDYGDLRINILRAKGLLTLVRDLGGSGLKVKPNFFHEGIPHEKTIQQIGESLNEIGQYAGEIGQQVRLEVHGPETQLLPNIKAIMDVADDPNVFVCWNCNPKDTDGEGFDYNFDLVKDRLGPTTHIHEMDHDDYPYDELMKKFVQMNYSGWLLLECSATNPEDKVAAMAKQREIGLKKISKFL